MPFRVVILGGYGHFGGRIARALAGEKDFQLLIAGRRFAAAAQFIAMLGSTAARLEALQIDHSAADFTTALLAVGADLLIHTCGPFQGQSYRVAEACLATGTHYIDLADGREFVCGLGRLDEAAKTKGVLLVSGASTLPAVSSAVVDEMQKRFLEVRSIRICILPGQQTPRGVATMASVLSYCGKPFRTLEAGRWRTVFGWQDMRRLHHPALGMRWAASCDVPDLELFPQRYRTVRTVSFNAGLELPIAQIGMWLLAALGRAGLVRDWRKYARPIKAIGDSFDRFGSDVGGMCVELSGLDAGGSSRGETWYLTAGSGDGPEIPCVPAIVLARKLAKSEIRTLGAQPCLGLMTFGELAGAFTHLDIDWEFVTSS